MKKNLLIILFLLLCITGCGKKNVESSNEEEQPVVNNIAYVCSANNSYDRGNIKTAVTLESLDGKFIKLTTITLNEYVAGVNVSGLMAADIGAYNIYNTINGVSTNFEKVNDYSYKSTVVIDIENLDYNKFVNTLGYSYNDKNVAIFRKNQSIDDALKFYSVDYECEELK